MGQHNNSLDPDVNLNVIGDKDNKGVKQYLKLMTDGYLTKSKQDTMMQAVKTLYESGFSIQNPSGSRSLNSQRLFQALWRTASRMKPLDVALHATGRSRDIESVATAGLQTVMDRGGYASALRDKGGAFFNLLMYGDGFIQIGASPDGSKDTPIVFNPTSPKNVYVDDFAIGMRAKGWGRNVTKCVVVSSMSWGELIEQWPEAEKIAGAGKIPKSMSYEGSQRTYDQEITLEDEVEVAYCYDIRNRNFMIFAGTACTILEEMNGDDYPFVMDDKPYIPLSHFICMPSAEGFWNHGIGAMVYRLAVISAKLLNMEVQHISNNVSPIELISVPHGQAASFFKKMKLAKKVTDAGGRGIVPVERAKGDPNGNSVSSQTLLTQNLFNEWGAVFDRLDLEFRRLGINIDELDTKSGTSATEIRALDENSNAFVKQMMEYNASETKFLTNVTIDFVKQFVQKSNKSPLNLTTTIGQGDFATRADGFTLGMLKDELSKHNYFVVVNSRTGSIPSNLMRRTELSDMLVLTAPGSAAQKQIVREIAQLNNITLPQEEAPAPGLPPEQGVAVDGELARPTATGTDRLSIDPLQGDTPAI